MLSDISPAQLHVVRCSAEVICILPEQAQSAGAICCLLGIGRQAQANQVIA